MYVYIYIYICKYIHVCMYKYIYMCINMYIYRCMSSEWTLPSLITVEKWWCWINHFQNRSLAILQLLPNSLSTRQFFFDWTSNCHCLIWCFSDDLDWLCFCNCIKNILVALLEIVIAWKRVRNRACLVNFEKVINCMWCYPRGDFTIGNTHIITIKYQNSTRIIHYNSNMTIHACLWKAKIWWMCDRIVVVIFLQWQLWGLMQCSHWVHQKGILIKQEGEGSIYRKWKEKDTEIERYKEGGRDRELERVKKSHLMCEPAPVNCGDGLSEEVYHWKMWLNVSMRCGYGVSVR